MLKFNLREREGGRGGGGGGRREGDEDCFQQRGEIEKSKETALFFSKPVIRDGEKNKNTTNNNKSRQKQMQNNEREKENETWTHQN